MVKWKPSITDAKFLCFCKSSENLSKKWSQTADMVSSEASPTIWSCYANLNHIIHFFRNWFLIRSMNTDKFTFAWPNVGLASPVDMTTLFCLIESSINQGKPSKIKSPKSLNLKPLLEQHWENHRFLLILHNLHDTNADQKSLICDEYLLTKSHHEYLNQWQNQHLPRSALAAILKNW